MSKKKKVDYSYIIINKD